MTVEATAIRQCPAPFRLGVYIRRPEHRRSATTLQSLSWVSGALISFVLILTILVRVEFSQGPALQLETRCYQFNMARIAPPSLPRPLMVFDDREPSAWRRS